MTNGPRRAPRAPSSNVRQDGCLRLAAGLPGLAQLTAAVAALAALLGWLVLSAGPAEAHPEVIGAEPPAGSVLSRTPARVRVVFSESVEPSGAEVLLTTPSGKPVARGGNTGPGTLELTPPSLASGVYEVRYHALGRDGHAVSGAYRLAVWPPGAPRPDGLDTVARTSRTSGAAGPQGKAHGIAIALTVPLAGILLASSALGGLGTPGRRGAQGRRSIPRTPREPGDHELEDRETEDSGREGGGSRLRRIAAAAIAAGIVAADALAAAAAGRSVVATTFGRLVIVHGVLAAGAGVLVFRSMRPEALKPKPPGGATPAIPGGRRLQGLWGGALLLPVVLTGHNVALSTRPVAAGVLDWIHLTAASLWVGSVVLVLTAGSSHGPGEPGWRGQARRFTPVAVGSAVVVVLTGTVQAAARVHRLQGFADTAYGRTLSLKILLVAAVGALGIAGRLFLQQAGSRRALAGEAAVFAGVLASVAVLVSLPPPAPPPPPSPGPLLTTALVGDQLLSVLVTPYRPGPNVVRVDPVTTEEPATPIGNTGEQARNPSAEPPLISTVDAGLRRPLTSAPSWEAPLDIPTRGTVRLRVEYGGQAWERAVGPHDPRGKAIRIGSVVSLSGAAAEECRSRLIGQLVAVEEADVGRRGRPFALETVDAGGGRREVEGSLRSRGIVSLAGACTGAGTDLGRLARQLGISHPGNPLAQAADPTAAGRVFASFLGQRGVKRAAILVDGSDAARNLASAFAAQGSVTGLEAVTVPAAAPSAARDAEVVVVAAAWEPSRAVLATARAQSWKPLRGIFLAPWLLHADILRSSIGGPTQVSVGLAVNPVSDGARRYLGALSALAPSEAPTVEGLAGYLEARAAMAAAEDPGAGPAVVRQLAESTAFPKGAGRTSGVTAQTGARIQFYTPTDVEILPAFLHGDHGAEAHAWLGDAGLAPVSGVLAASRH